MDSAAAHAGAPLPYTFTDGLGLRRRTTDPVRHEPIELLCLRSELTSVPSFEFALRERVSHLAPFRKPCYAGVRSVERLKNPPSALVLVSDVTAGVRLSDVLAFAEQSTVPLDIDAALCLLRQVVPALSLLHEHAPDVAHGALAPERIVVTPGARIMMVEHVLGAALSELQFSRERYWKELRVAIPGTTAPISFNHRSDVTQLGAVALALILGRPLGDDELPSKLGDVVSSSWAISARGGLEPLPAGLRAWLMRALQLDPRESFPSAIEAHAELERVLGDTDYMAAPTTLESFLAHYRTSVETVADEPPAPAERRPAAGFGEPAAAPVAEVRSTAVSNDAPAASERRPGAAFGEPSTPVRPIAPGGPWGAERGAEPPYHLSDPPSTAVTAPASTATAASKSSAATPVVLPKPPEPAAASSPRPQEPARHADLPTWQDAGAGRDAYAPRQTASPVDLAARTFGDTPERTSGKKLWMVAAALVVLAVGGVSLPAARRLLSPGAATVDGTLVVNTNPPGAKLFVDGVDRGVTPVTVALKPGPHSLEVRGDGPPRLMPITIAVGAQVSQYLELPKVAAAVGQLHVRTEPAGARVSVDGAAKGTSPVTIADLTPGEHLVHLDSDLGSVKQTVTIEAGVTASLTVPLGAPEGAPVSGWISLTAPAEVQLFENKRLIGTSQTDRVMVSAGRHEIEIVNEALGFRVVRTVQVSPGKVSSIKVDFPKGTIALNATPWAEVWVDGEKIGETPIGNLQVTIGTHDVLFRHPDLGEQRHKATVSLTAPARLSVDMRKK
jgi:serine/threonine protein kinase